MRTLQDNFIGRASQKGFKFNLMERDISKALYKKEDEFGNVYYEAIVIRFQPETTIGGNVIEAGEKMPSDNEYGVYGWCCSDYNKAKTYYDNISYERKTGDN